MEMPKSPRKEVYHPLTGHSDDRRSSVEDELFDYQDHSDSQSQQRYHDRRNYILWALYLASNVISFVVGGYFGTKIHTNSLDRECSMHTSAYSPLTKAVDITYAYTNFNGSFLKETIYRKDASPEVDAAWEALGVDYRPGIIPLEDGPAVGLEERHVQRSEKYGAGYFVNVEGMHHLHCLNLVRKSLYFNYAYYKDLGMHAFKNDEHILKLHITHCLDTVRQVLMCNVDTGLLGQVWFDPQKPAAFPDFNTRHKCKNFDAVRQWAETLQAPLADQIPMDYVKPADPRYILPSTP
ncbi:hypothetical protein PpBr36_07589 [Pyricularia pennisetigena]|uniref:hypothetical protein n=1 Tax=Pyricularia pennisetigena TaxID=1578925 RepID=UPI0011528D9D|nr:hypothetical protein PpBr36_07589 [Pyricularia pennisetigena]TLS25891.1 hypothetical protein PpBr36_07589 [Pyricularia pennisetigena]